MTRFGFVGTYPPTMCGIATFASALHRELIVNGSDTGAVVSVVDELADALPAEVTYQLINGDARSRAGALRHLNACDVVLVQHEYGIYGGRDGAEVLTLLSQLKVPRIVVLHTVLPPIDDHFAYVTQGVVAQADAVVTLSHAAADQLLSAYDIEVSKVHTIPHGATTGMRHVAPVTASTATSSNVTSHASTSNHIEAVPHLFTWGLIGPGKGIEWAILAVAELRQMGIDVTYTVAGRTHPKVHARDGEAYRTSLQALIAEHDVDDRVTLEDGYMSDSKLDSLLSSADVVVLPYDSTQQVTSGVLSEAVAAGKPVVATRFPHAVELLGHGSGLLVPHSDPRALAQAIAEIVRDPARAREMTAASGDFAGSVGWSVVAQRYRALAREVIRSRVAA
jgi:polysaccharide biosynthesis protein PslF